MKFAYEVRQRTHGPVVVPDYIDRRRIGYRPRRGGHRGLHVVAQVRAVTPEGVDAVFHFAGDPAPYASVVKPGGVLVSTMLTSPDDVPAEESRVASIYANPTRVTLARLADNQTGLRTTVTVQQAYTLDRRRTPSPTSRPARSANSASHPSGVVRVSGC